MAAKTFVYVTGGEKYCDMVKLVRKIHRKIRRVEEISFFFSCTLGRLCALSFCLAVLFRSVSTTQGKVNMGL